MLKQKQVQHTHSSEQLRALHGALIGIVSLMNRPRRDDALIREAGISLDRALFPLLVGIERLGPIGVVEIADRLGRDYTTVSRQVAKLESLGLVCRKKDVHDRRVREAIATSKGKAATDAVNIARQRLGQTVFEKWNPQDLANLVALLQRFLADAGES